MKKKLLSVLLAAAMVLSLAACADKKGNEKADPEKIVSVSSETSVEEKAPASVEASVSDDKTEASVSESTEETKPEAPAQDEVVVFGTTEGNTYTNEFFGFKVEAPDGYSFADEDEIASLGMMSTERIKGNNESMGSVMEQLYEKGLVATDFYIYAPGGLGTMNLTVSSAGIGLRAGQESAFIEAMMPSLVSTYEAAGISDVTVESGLVTCMGREFPCIKASGNVVAQDLSIETHIIQIPMIKDGYMANITAGTYLSDSAEELIALISALE